MTIRSVVHRGLRRFMERNDASGLNPHVVQKIRNILTLLQEMEAHQFTGDRKGTCLHVTRNWRITFRIDQTEGEILDLDYEDYH